MMVVLPCLVLVLSVVALPKRDLLGLIDGDSAVLSPTRTVVRPSTRSPPSQIPTSTVATLHGQPTPTPTLRINSAESTPVLASSSVLPVSAESNATDHSSKTWQIVGITIIAVLFVATSIACSMFFDHLWIFLKDVICCKPRPVPFEELITDCDAGTLSSCTSDYTGKATPENAARPRELPWNADKDTLHPQLSRRNDHPPPV